MAFWPIITVLFFIFVLPDLTGKHIIVVNLVGLNLRWMFVQRCSLAASYLSRRLNS